MDINSLQIIFYFWKTYDYLLIFPLPLTFPFQDLLDYIA
jgi:hypothetical protein